MLYSYLGANSFNKEITLAMLLNFKYSLPCDDSGESISSIDSSVYSVKLLGWKFVVITRATLPPKVALL